MCQIITCLQPMLLKSITYHIVSYRILGEPLQPLINLREQVTLNTLLRRASFTIIAIRKGILRMNAISSMAFQLGIQGMLEIKEGLIKSLGRMEELETQVFKVRLTTIAPKLCKFKLLNLECMMRNKSVLSNCRHN